MHMKLFRTLHLLLNHAAGAGKSRLPLKYLCLCLFFLVLLLTPIPAQSMEDGITGATTTSSAKLASDHTTLRTSEITQPPMELALAANPRALS